MKIPFNKPYLTGNEISYIEQVVRSGNTSGNGDYTLKCQQFFENRYGFKKCLLTTSCTDALEMAAILLNIQEGDEVIMPSYNFVSPANAFVLRGAKIVFADSSASNPNIDPKKIEDLITAKTKAIVVIHYAGIACNMDEIMAIAKKHKLFVVEDAAQAIDSFYRSQPLGSIGDLGAFSFHKTKNIVCGEGGLLVVNEERFKKRAEVVWEMGTNRAAFFRGEINKYEWVDLGSSFLMSEILAAYLFAQIESLDVIQEDRKKTWNSYFEGLSELESKGVAQLPFVPDFATNNAHIFYLVVENSGLRDRLIESLASKNIKSVFHYQSLHSSNYFKDRHDGRKLAQCDRYSEGLIRLPLYVGLDLSNVNYIVENILGFFD